MAITFLNRLAPDAETRWLEALHAALPDETITSGANPQAEIAIVANPPRGVLASLPNLAFVQSAWAGVDSLLDDPDLPRVPIARLVDPGLAAQMAQATAAHVLYLHRQVPAYAAQQRRGLWRQLPQPPAAERRVGFLGFGELAGAAANLLESIGFQTYGWSRRLGDLDTLLATIDIVVNLLPLTDRTRGILSAPAFERMKRGAAIINLARGAHLVEDDLIAALDAGQLSHAVLDVFEAEPLVRNHPFWSHPQITVTPHVAAITDPVSASAVIAANIARFRAGQPLEGLVNRKAGY
ncbi:MAG: glyoxylate/hydroxypyruvate reductase A [Phenylobacterium sp.]|uniref:2-hydroxyacid dehydrogenase n=1 Tax=Phenylobacterium sp. TaxID=1871053 RepID=UPI0025E7DBFC|nr:glyoxylate/hydroxypyruvate reductase A [Phenylobacterium sp.]MBA4013537.1 glyoxylate/hydroxypyruvate reductase A [Phenylobacterium sp.]